MKNWRNYVRRYLIWMGASYVLIFAAFQAWVFQPQRREVVEAKAKRARIEQTYVMVKSSQNFLNSLAVGIGMVNARLGDFKWLSASPDPNNTLFQRIGGMAEKQRLKLISLQRIEDREKGTPYFCWRLQFQGRFPDVLRFVNDVENSPQYLRIEEIEIVPDEDGQSVFSITVLGIKQRGEA